MTVYIDNHTFHYETENLVRLFFPDEKIIIEKEIPENTVPPYIYTSMNINDGNAHIYVRVNTEGFDEADVKEIALSDKDFEKTAERTMAVCLYKLLCKLTGTTKPWGILTGVRPIKLFRRLSDKNGKEYAESYFRDKLLVSDEKIRLSAWTEENERKILALSKPMSVSLYISIPFCPSRCSYCSFISQTADRAKKLIAPYFELLCRELECTAEIVRDKKLILESVYIGGGTPTTLSAEQLYILIKTVRDNFDMSGCREFTVEAGRPDTIDEEKLKAISEGRADRISINPQTLNDSVLEVIGRKHTSKQIYDTFALARKMGFANINTDLIAGLPTDTAESFSATLDGIFSLAPESITVHTLALKRSSRLTLQGHSIGGDSGAAAAKMLELCSERLPKAGYEPYYLYRQSRIEGGLENTGWSKKGFEGIYNVFVMDETHTVIGCGAGAVTKLKNPYGSDLTRIFNYKYPYEYISGFEEILRRKEQVRTFYNELS